MKYRVKRTVALLVPDQPIWMGPGTRPVFFSPSEPIRLESGRMYAVQLGAEWVGVEYSDQIRLESGRMYAVHPRGAGAVLVELEAAADEDPC